MIHVATGKLSLDNLFFHYCFSILRQINPLCKFSSLFSSLNQNFPFLTLSLVLCLVMRCQGSLTDRLTDTVRQTLKDRSTQYSAPEHTSYLSRIPRIYPCKFSFCRCKFLQILREKLAFFTDLTRKIGVFWCKFYSRKILTV